MSEVNADDSLRFSIQNTTKGKPPRLPFREMKEYVLGKDYELSLVFAGDARTRKLNLTYRNKDKPADVLSFPLSKKEGELFINLKRTRMTARKFDEPFENFVGFLFIHGMLHLKDMDHGSKMESEERRIRAHFDI